MTDEELRRLLDDAVADVQPTDRRAELWRALHDPKEKTMTDSPRPRPWTWMLAGGGLAAAVIVAVFAVGGLGDSDPVADDSDTANQPGTSSTADATTAPEPSDDATTVDPGDGDGETTVPAYFVVDTERAGPRLVREFQRVDSGDDLLAALDLVTSGEALDPDYRTLWPGASFASAEIDEGAGVIRVGLADNGWRTRPDGMSAKDAKLALQQVVYTAQGVAQKRLPVQFALDGATETVFGIDTSAGISAASPLAVLNHISLTTPEQGAAVSGGSLHATGVGNSFEATVAWRVLQGDEVVDEGSDMLQGDWMQDKLVPFDFTVDVSGLDPGDYTFWVSTDDPTGGTEGVGAMTDDKDFTIE